MDNKIIYFDNAATTWPKIPETKSVLNKFCDECYASPNRTSSNENLLLDVRNKILEYFDCPEGYDVAIVPSATIGMNIVISSLIKQNKNKILTTNYEHHCVYRPLTELNVNYEIVDYLDGDYKEHPERMLEKIDDNTTAIIMNHASNVTGQVFNIENVAKEVKDKDVTFILDISQSAGIEDISIKNMNVDIAVGSAHKHLYGVPGIGYIIFNKNITLSPIYFGGTGKFSSSMKQPDLIPDKLESGTFNTIGLLSIFASLNAIDANVRAESRKKEKELVEYFLNESKNIEKIRIYGKDLERRTGVVAFNIEGMDPNFVVAPYLEKSANIWVRSGLHCAPIIHKVIGTFPEGCIRISFSKYNSKAEIDVLIDLLKKL